MLATLAFVAAGLKVAVPGLDGKSVQVLPSTSSKGVVAFFVLAGCPIANGYAPEMNRIAKEFAPKGWKFYLVYADGSGKLEPLKAHYKEFGYAFQAVVDDRQALVRLAHATKTPEAAVFSRKGKLLYDGRIDDLYYSLGRKRIRARTHDLRDALRAATAGKPVKNPRTTAIGCFIPTR